MRSAGWGWLLLLVACGAEPGTQEVAPAAPAAPEWDMRAESWTRRIRPDPALVLRIESRERVERELGWLSPWLSWDPGPVDREVAFGLALFASGLRGSAFEAQWVLPASGAAAGGDGPEWELPAGTIGGVLASGVGLRAGLSTLLRGDPHLARLVLSAMESWRRGRWAIGEKDGHLRLRARIETTAESAAPTGPDAADLLRRLPLDAMIVLATDRDAAALADAIEPLLPGLRAMPEGVPLAALSLHAEACDGAIAVAFDRGEEGFTLVSVGPSRDATEFLAGFDRAFARRAPVRTSAPERRTVEGLTVSCFRAEVQLEEADVDVAGAGPYLAYRAPESDAEGIRVDAAVLGALLMTDVRDVRCDSRHLFVQVPRMPGPGEVLDRIALLTGGTARVSVGRAIAPEDPEHARLRGRVDPRGRSVQDLGRAGRFAHVFAWRQGVALGWVFAVEEDTGLGIDDLAWAHASVVRKGPTDATRDLSFRLMPEAVARWSAAREHGPLVLFLDGEPVGLLAGGDGGAGEVGDFTGLPREQAALVERIVCRPRLRHAYEPVGERSYGFAHREQMQKRLEEAVGPDGIQLAFGAAGGHAFVVLGTDPALLRATAIAVRDAAEMPARCRAAFDRVGGEAERFACIDLGAVAFWVDARSVTASRALTDPVALAEWDARLRKMGTLRVATKRGESGALQILAELDGRVAAWFRAR